MIDLLSVEVLGSAGAGLVFGLGVHVGATRAALRVLSRSVDNLATQFTKAEDDRKEYEKTQNRRCQEHDHRTTALELRQPKHSGSSA